MQGFTAVYDPKMSADRSLKQIGKNTKRVAKENRKVVSELRIRDREFTMFISPASDE